VLFHFSEDSSIGRFVPHVPRTNPEHAPAVWAIDEAHAPLYWFPRDCPRVTAWPRTDAEASAFREAFATDARRIHAIELAWLDRMRSTRLFCYAFDEADFRPWELASGQWICEHEVDPVTVTPVGDLLDAHVRADIELRLLPSLWPLHDVVVGDAHEPLRWDFSIVRIANAQSRR
jgi:hypothetical protein